MLEKIKLFYQTFGYFIVRNTHLKNALPRIQDEYDRTLEFHYGADWSNKTLPPLINDLSRSQAILSTLESIGIVSVVDILLGSDWAFHGCDFSTFRSQSSAHRDSFPAFSCLKIGIYLQESSVRTGGQLRVIPGSHQWGSSFAVSSAKGLRWPKGSGWDFEMISELERSESSKGGYLAKLELPMHPLELMPGDIVLFDNRLIHDTTPSAHKLRRMVSLNFFEGFEMFTQRNPSISKPKYEDAVAQYYFASCAIERSFGRVIDPLSITTETALASQLSDRFYGNSNACKSRAATFNTISLESAFDIITGRLSLVALEESPSH